MQCPGCGNQNPEVKWDIFGDPEEDRQDHRVPRWSQYTLCCGRSVGEIHTGYSAPDGSQRILSSLSFRLASFLI